MEKSIQKVLVANRGEIAVRILRTLTELDIESVVIYPEDDRHSLHVKLGDKAIGLSGVGAAAYLDIVQVVEIAVRESCDAIHPGYGFLAENVEFARQCEAANICFIGPEPEVLDLFGDKLKARKLAEDAGVPVLPASSKLESAAQAAEFLALMKPANSIIFKAVGGGGGRGMRMIHEESEIEDALARCSSEAEASFGNGDLYAEMLVEKALHIEVQILGDSSGNVSHLGERDCSIQRRHQKLVEIAPSPQLPEALRTQIHEAAVSLATSAGYHNIGTFEFLVDGSDLSSDSAFFFIEANPRIQVEHTVTEEIFGVDLVRTQIALAQGETLASLGLSEAEKPVARGYAIQFRVNMERLKANGMALPRSGTLSQFEVPQGLGVRVDTFGYQGYQTTPHYDSLLAKVIVSSSSRRFDDVVIRSRRVLDEFVIDGLETNISVLMNLIDEELFLKGAVYTRFIDDALDRLIQPRETRGSHRAGQQKFELAGAKLEDNDPLAVLRFGHESRETDVEEAQYGEGMLPQRADMQSTIVSLAVSQGDEVQPGQELMVLNAMKMEHVVTATCVGVVHEINVGVGDTVPEDSVLIVIEESDGEAISAEEEVELDLDIPREDLAELLRRRALTTDASRLRQVEKRHAMGGRTARENIDDLCDEDTFMQYGSLAVGMQLRGTVDELLDYAPSDGLVMGLGHINGEDFDEVNSRAVVMSYDYSVLAGTQGGMNHKMMDRMFQTADKLNSPIVLFSEGGGGRAGGGSRAARAQGGDQPITGGGGLNTPSWNLLGKLSGRVPVIGINSGLCFAGNAALLGCCDVIIATANSSIGMGGPAMIEGGGLGVYRPEEVGPMSVQVPNGVVDIAVSDEEAAVAAAKKYLSYFQGKKSDWEAPDQRLLRHAIPENRLRVYDIRSLIETLCDVDSVLELRAEFGKAMITSLVRMEGRPVGIVANNPGFLSGAIDSDAADKATRFIKLCDGFDIPILFLCDTPGIMVGPEAEKTALVRHAARMFVVSAGVTVPTFMVILRKAYGLGAQAMGGGCHRVPGFVVAWPTSEFGGMGLEGQVKLGQRARLEAIEDPVERQEAYERMVANAYERGRGLNAAHVYEIDDVIDPADTRRWVMAGLKGAAPRGPGFQPKAPVIDTW